VNVRQEEFEDTKGVIRIRISKNRPSIQWPKEKVQKDKQRSTKQTCKVFGSNKIKGPKQDRRRSPMPEGGKP
jgi:hypothetical protein